MIKTGIVGADSREAGELLRILVNHPDVDLLEIVAPRVQSLAVSAVHHGLIGEGSYKFSSELHPDGLDAVFVAPGAPEGTATALLSLPDLRVIDFSGRPELDPAMVHAVSEIFRKPMVRGARHAQVLHPLASLALVALYPLAAHMLLNADLHFDVKAPEAVISPGNIDTAARQITGVLAEVQKSFSANISIDAESTQRNRSMSLHFNLPCQLSLDEIDRIYDSIYDDHNFTFVIHSPAGPEEVSGTHKCVVTIDKPDADTLSVTAIGDCRLRGGAGDAVHAFNLLFGLHERTGLALKAAKF